MPETRDMGGAASREGDAEIVYGLHAVRHALERGRARAGELWVQEDKLSATHLRGVLELAHTASVAVRPVARQQLDRETGYARHQGLALLRKASAERPMDLDDMLSRRTGAAPLLLVLDGVLDPRNLGACVRTADAAGVDGVIIPKDRAAPMTAAARKVASGAAESIAIISVTNLARALRSIKDAGIWVIGTAEDGDADLYDADLTLPTALVMGGEEKGLRQNIRAHCDRVVRLPMRGAVESLNVAVAAGICLFEAVRQRRTRI